MGKTVFYKTILVLTLFFGVSLQSSAGNDQLTDTIPCDTCVESMIPIALEDTTGTGVPLFMLDADHYHKRYGVEDLLDKVTDNWGNGFEDLYGTRNMRVIVHGAAYRGGANNYFHRDGRRNNQNPLPEDGVRNLCEEGFSASVYLYRRNWDETPPVDSCDCLNNTENAMDYYQLDYHDNEHVREMLGLVHKSITDPNTGPVYLHCWNGWHASGYLSAVMLKQFCAYDNNTAVNYWDLGTDGMNKSPRYQTQRDRIKAFEPFPEYAISDSLQGCLCPGLPDDIDSSQLHIDLDHLITVPEAIPVGHTIPLSNIKFKPSSTTFSSLAGAKKDMDRVVQALNTNPQLMIELGGHTDNSGKSATNYALSKKRAKRVYDYLVNAGISPERLTWKGYGPSQPIATNKYKTTRAQNRRIEVKLISKKKEDFTRLVEEEDTTSNSNEETTTTPEVVVPKEEKLVTTQAGTVADLAASPKNYTSGDKLLMAQVKFEPYSTNISDPNCSDLVALLKALKSNPSLKVELSGYSDNSGDPVGNVTLSQSRAKSVYQFLLDNGVSEKQITYKGYGPKNPRYTNATKEGRAKNRRIEVTVR